MPKPSLSSGSLCGRDALIQNLSCASTDIWWEGMPRTPLYLIDLNFAITYVTRQGILVGVRACFQTAYYKQ